MRCRKSVSDCPAFQPIGQAPEYWTFLTSTTRQCVRVGFLKTIQWLLGLVSAFYFYKAPHGNLRDGDGLKASIVAVASFSIVLVTSGFVRIE